MNVGACYGTLYNDHSGITLVAVSQILMEDREFIFLSTPVSFEKLYLPFPLLVTHDPQQFSRPFSTPCINIEMYLVGVVVRNSTANIYCIFLTLHIFDV